jgi:hypothetical protein
MKSSAAEDVSGAVIHVTKHKKRKGNEKKRLQ